MTRSAGSRWRRPTPPHRTRRESPAGRRNRAGPPPRRPFAPGKEKARRSAERRAIIFRNSAADAVQASIWSASPPTGIATPWAARGHVPPAAAVRAAVPANAAALANLDNLVRWRRGIGDRHRLSAENGRNDSRSRESCQPGWVKHDRPLICKYQPGASFLIETPGRPNAWQPNNECRLNMALRIKSPLRGGRGQRLIANSRSSASRANPGAQSAAGATRLAAGER